MRQPQGNQFNAFVPPPPVRQIPFNQPRAFMNQAPARVMKSKKNNCFCSNCNKECNCQQFNNYKKVSSRSGRNGKQLRRYD
jgi:hypothetical protein